MPDEIPPPRPVNTPQPANSGRDAKPLHDELSGWSPSSDENAKATGLQFDQLMTHLLNDPKNEGRGVFLGEAHDMPSIQQSITRLMPHFRLNGVTTLSLELPQNLVDDMVRGNVPPEKMQWYPKYYLDSMKAVVDSARRNGINVIGHEMPENSLPSDRIYNANDIRRISGEMMDKVSSYEGINARNRFAAGFIEEHRGTGKVVVLGGALHSGMLLSNAPAPHTITSGHHSRIGTDVRGYRGLDKLLGVPSVNFDIGGPTGATFRAHETGPRGELSNMNSDFTVTLPASLTQLKREGGYQPFPPTLPPKLKPISNER
jgi:hypothetical protein